MGPLEIVVLLFVGGVAYFTDRWYLSDGDALNSEWRSGSRRGVRNPIFVPITRLRL